MTSEIVDRHGYEDIRQHVRGYVIVFGALLALTVATVGVSYMHLPARAAIAVALLIATIKAGLVAVFFMHLRSERRGIYALLAVVGLCLVVLGGLTILGWYDQIRIS
jgi:cytochrome c oxidase subunit 4